MRNKTNNFKSEGGSMKMAQFLSLLACLFSSLVYAADATIAEVTHRQLQAVNTNGVGTYSATDR